MKQTCETINVYHTIHISWNSSKSHKDITININK